MNLMIWTDVQQKHTEQEWVIEYFLQSPHFKKLIEFLSVSVFECTRTVACMGRSGGVQEESLLSFHHMGPGD